MHAVGYSLVAPASITALGISILEQLLGVAFIVCLFNMAVTRITPSFKPRKFNLPKAVRKQPQATAILGLSRMHMPYPSCGFTSICVFL